MKRLFFSLSVVLLLGISSTATAACAYLNVRGSGGWVAPNQEEEVYGPYGVTCLGAFLFDFEDLSGGYFPKNAIEHHFQRKVGGSWITVSMITKYNSKTAYLSFVPTQTGQYRYIIKNVGQSSLRDWKVKGRVPLFTIPGI